MLHKHMFVASLMAVLLMVVSCAVRASSSSDATKAEIDQLRKDIDTLRAQLNKTAPMGKTSMVDRALESKAYGPNADVTTQKGKLTITGLLQAWYYAPQTDHRALFDDQTINGVDDSNEGSQNNSFRIRRTQLGFKMDVTKDVTAYVQIDPANEANSFPLVTDDQANVGYIYKSLANVGPQYQSINAGPGSPYVLNNVQTGAGLAGTMLEDAWINYHDVVPHHDFYVGQMKPWVGEEGLRNSGQLDFAERSFCGLLDDRYDLGAGFHGTWCDQRFQYWGGVYDDAGNFFGSATEAGPLDGGVQTQIGANRSATTSNKDLGFRILLKPAYKVQDWGTLEIGGAGLLGRHGSSENIQPLTAPDNGLTAVKTSAFDWSAWIYYKPLARAVSGLWIRGEWKFIRDRMAPGSVIDLAGNGTGPDANVQELGRPLHTQGYYAAIGYKLSESTFSESCPSWLRPFEFAGRYQEFENVMVANPENPVQTDVYATQVITLGANYYISRDVKIQANYNFVINPKPQRPDLTFNNTKDDSFVISFQVAF